MKHVYISSNNSDPVGTPGQILVLGLAVVVFAVVGLEVSIVGSIQENSVTELTQELLVLAAAVLFGITAWRCPKLSSMLVLFAGLFGCMFIRELDVVFDQVFRGFWFYPALLVAVGTIFYAMRCPRLTFRQLRDHLMTSPFRSVALGLLIVLVISRIAGTGRLWEFILANETTAQYCKNVVQEGLELWGYVIIAAGAWCVKLQLTKTSRPASNRWGTSWIHPQSTALKIVRRPVPVSRRTNHG